MYTLTRVLVWGIPAVFLGLCLYSNVAATLILLGIVGAMAALAQTVHLGFQWHRRQPPQRRWIGPMLLVFVLMVLYGLARPR